MNMISCCELVEECADSCDGAERMSLVEAYRRYNWCKDRGSFLPAWFTAV